MNRFKLSLLALAAASFVGVTCAQTTTVPTPVDPVSPPASDALIGTTRSTNSASPTSGLNQAPPTVGMYDLGGIGKRERQQEDLIFSEPVQGLPIRLENGIFIYPGVYAGLGYNSNVGGFNTDANSSTVFSLQPKLVAELKKSGDRYTLTYNGNHTRYASSAEDNNTNHELAVAGDNYFSPRSRLGWSLSYLKSADPRGTTFVEGFTQTSPDRWHAPIAQALYIYGAKGAQGRFEVEGALQNKRYDNNRIYTYLSDANTQSASGRFFWRFMPKTHAVFELRHLRTNYISADSPLDNNDNRYLVGLQWDAAAKTTGGIKVGYQKKNFAGTTVPDKGGATWEGNLRWLPLTYSAVELTAGRSLSDPQGNVGDYVRNTLTSLQWTHRWTNYITSRATLATIQADYGGTVRSDSTRNIGLAVFYEIGRSFRAGLEIANTRRNSNDNLYDFRRNTTFLSLEGTL